MRPSGSRLTVDGYSISRNFVHFSKGQISLVVDHVCRNWQDLSRRRIMWRQPKAFPRRWAASAVFLTLVAVSAESLKIPKGECPEFR